MLEKKIHNPIPDIPRLKWQIRRSNISWCILIRQSAKELLKSGVLLWIQLMSPNASYTLLGRIVEVDHVRWSKIMFCVTIIAYKVWLPVLYMQILGWPVIVDPGDNNSLVLVTPDSAISPPMIGFRLAFKWAFNPKWSDQDHYWMFLSREFPHTALGNNGYPLGNYRAFLHHYYFHYPKLQK